MTKIPRSARSRQSAAAGPRLRQRRSRRRAGFFLLDAVIGLALVTVLAIMMVTTEARQRRATQRLADARAAVRAAEETLIDLRDGRAPAANITIVSVPGADAVAGRTWVEVRATVGDQTRSLTGLVPSTAVWDTPVQPPPTPSTPSTTQEAR